MFLKFMQAPVARQVTKREFGSSLNLIGLEHKLSHIEYHAHKITELDYSIPRSE